MAAIAAVYHFLATTDGALPLVLAIGLLIVGSMLKGHGAYVEHTVERHRLFGDRLVSTRHIPAQAPLARTWMGRAFGGLLIAAGFCLFCYGLVSCAAQLHWP